jgi:hypothetical protein
MRRVCLRGVEVALELQAIELFAGTQGNRHWPRFGAVHGKTQLVAKGENHFLARRHAGDELFLIRRGAVRIMLPLSDKQSRIISALSVAAPSSAKWLSSMARYAFGQCRSRSAIPNCTCCRVVPSTSFAEEHKKLGAAA